MGPLGWQETLVIFVLALLIFGPKKLPELGRTIGKAITEFRRASSEFKATWDREMANLERETESVKEITREVQSELTDYGSYYYDGAPYEPSYDYSAESPYSVGASEAAGAESTPEAAQPENSEAIEQAEATGPVASSVPGSEGPEEPEKVVASHAGDQAGGLSTMAG